MFVPARDVYDLSAIRTHQMVMVPIVERIDGVTILERHGFHQSLFLEHINCSIDTRLVSSDTVDKLLNGLGLR